MAGSKVSVFFLVCMVVLWSKTGLAIVQFDHLNSDNDNYGRGGYAKYQQELDEQSFWDGDMDYSDAVYGIGVRAMPHMDIGDSMQEDPLMGLVDIPRE